jgi:hypothetical protein
MNFPAVNTPVPGKPIKSLLRSSSRLARYTHPGNPANCSTWWTNVILAEIFHLHQRPCGSSSEKDLFNYSADIEALILAVRWACSGTKWHLGCVYVNTPFGTEIVFYYDTFLLHGLYIYLL